MWKRKYQSDDIYADHAEPKSIAELKARTWHEKVRPVKKGLIAENMVNNGYLI